MSTFNMMEKKTGNREDAKFYHSHYWYNQLGETVLDLSTSLNFYLKTLSSRFELKVIHFQKGR
ncbi:MAG: hypothetical protein Q9M40_06725 [Sulfurimonas sp.]|nr:hypothetical protein [Sulfurimonas sp.]